MNLPNHFETSQPAFYIVACSLIILSCLSIRHFIRLCSRRKIDFFQYERDEPKLQLPQTNKKRLNIHEIKRGKQINE
jgi:hypothetical protein